MNKFSHISPVPFCDKKNSRKRFCSDRKYKLGAARRRRVYFQRAGCQNDCVLRHGWQKANAIIGKVLMTGAAYHCMQRTKVLNVFYLYMCEWASGTLIHNIYTLCARELSACVLLKVFIPAATDHNEIEKSMTYSFHNQSIWIPSSLRHRTHNVTLMSQKISMGLYIFWYLMLC